MGFLLVRNTPVFTYPFIPTGIITNICYDNPDLNASKELRNVLLIAQAQVQLLQWQELSGITFSRGKNLRLNNSNSRLPKEKLNYQLTNWNTGNE